MEAGPSLFDEVGDAFPGASPGSAIAVSTLTETAKEIVEGAFLPMWIRGEVSDFKAHRNGHWYFCLRDATAQVRCVVWSRDARRIPAPPDDGMQVAALGRLTVYAARGEMQLSVSQLEAEGDGLWRKALELTRRRLEVDGLLDPARKRAMPAFPRTVGVVTSPDGAALRDIVSVLRRRGAGVRLVVAPAAVQGEGAVDELCAAIERLGRWGEADVIIVGRGGGAREDLWAFNDERVARALAASPVPTISAVGHEIDISICDLVADMRAATPTAAAEIVTRDRDELVAALRARGTMLTRGVGSHIAAGRAHLRSAALTLGAEVRAATASRRAAIETLGGRLHALSPLATLERGYAAPRRPDGRPLAQLADYEIGADIELVVRGGVVAATVTATTPADGGTAS